MSLIIWSQCRKQILTWVGALVEWLWEETPVLKGVGFQWSWTLTSADIKQVSSVSTVAGNNLTQSKVSA